MQNRTRTCSIDPDNNEEPLNEEAQSCTLPTCTWKDHKSKKLEKDLSMHIVTLPPRADTSRATFRLGSTNHFISSNKVILTTQYLIEITKQFILRF